MLDGGCFLEAMRSGHVHNIGISVPNQFHGSEGMVPSEVAATNAWPMSREIAMLANNLTFLNREDSPTSEDWDSFCAGFKFMFRITRYNPLLFFSAKMRNVINRHEGDVPVG